MSKYIFLTGIKILRTLLVIVVLLYSCTGDYEKINTKPYEPTELDLEGDNFRAGSFFPQMQMVVIPVEINVFQLAQNLTGDIYSGYMAAINSWFGGINYTVYSFPDNWLNNPFKNVFVKTFGAWLDIKKISEEKAPENFALAQILKIASLHRITDAQGPIPYSKVGTGTLTVAYDNQEEVYRLFFQELNDAISILTEFVQRNPGATPLKEYDLVYGGNFTQWIKFANSLKLRLAIRIAYADPEAARTFAEEAVSHPIGVITSNNDNASLKSANGIIVTNPLKKMWDAYSDIRMGASMQSILKGYNDPRISRYFQLSTIKEETDYFGVRTGILISNKSPYLAFSSPKVEADDPIVWMTASEVSLLKSEGALRGWNMGGTVQDLYENGIRLSFKQAKVSGIEDYINDDQNVPADYVNPVIRTQNIAARSQITIKWDETSDFEAKLERIITQKWIALYPNGQEAWTEFRRTGYPRLFPVVANHSEGTIDSEIQIRRLPFPPIEYITNLDNIEQAIVLLGGPDNGGTRLWWDCKPATSVQN